ncbi:MAG TPA: deoxyribose-phosphate aldolase [Planctomycetia bacterium]|nr:deoxyribose-phosphate aldolase [Planctomycetia bacterium]
MTPTCVADVAKMLDHSLLNPKMTDADLEAGCVYAAGAKVASVCIKPYYVARAAEILAGSGVATGTVIGFPQGGHATAVKVFESERAIADGAVELDMVVNVGKVLSKDWTFVRADVAAVLEVVSANRALLKVIFENSAIEEEHKLALCRICGELGVHFVKTSTGYGDGGATDADLKLMRANSPPSVQVKAAGGVRTYGRLVEVAALGVTRVGATASAPILAEALAALGN